MEEVAAREWIQTSRTEDAQLNVLPMQVHQAYDKGQAAYFATPPVQLIMALQASLKLILEGPVSLQARFTKHQEASRKVKAAVDALGLKQVPLHPNSAGANGMTAVYAPSGHPVPSIVGGLAGRGIVVAAGLHQDIKTQYFRIVRSSFTR